MSSHPMIDVSKLGAGANASRYLCFSLSKDDYAIPLLSVREVIVLPELTPVPHTPIYFSGIMNLRGRIVSVVDLRLKLGLRADRTEETCVVVCELPHLTLGIVVSSVNRVLALDPESIGARPEGAVHIQGVATVDKKLVLMLDLAAALGADATRVPGHTSGSREDG